MTDDEQPLHDTSPATDREAWTAGPGAAGRWAAG